MEISEILDTHIRWKLDLIGRLESGVEIDAHEVARDDHCELGRWLYRNLGRFQDNDRFMDLYRDHSEFHNCVRDAVICWQAGDRECARELVRDDMARLSHRIVRQLSALHREWESEGEEPDMLLSVAS